MSDVSEPAIKKQKRADTGRKCLFCGRARENKGAGPCVRIPFVKEGTDPSKTTRFKYHHSFPKSDIAPKGHTGEMASAADLLSYRKRFLVACGDRQLSFLYNHRIFVHTTCLEARMTRRAKVYGWLDHSDPRSTNPALCVFSGKYAFVEQHYRSGLPLPAKHVSTPDGAAEIPLRHPTLSRRAASMHENLQSKIQLLEAELKKHPRLIKKCPPVMKMLGEIRDHSLQYAQLRAQTMEAEDQVYEQCLNKVAEKDNELERTAEELSQLKIGEREGTQRIDELLKQLHESQATSGKPLRFTKEQTRHAQRSKKSASNHFHALTGLQSPDLLIALYDVVASIVQHPDGRPLGQSKTGGERSLSPHDQLFLVLFLLHTGSKWVVAASLWDMDRSYVGKCFRRWIKYLYRAANLLMPIPSRENIRAVYPPSWREAFACDRIRYVLDATNWNVEAPRRGEEQTVTYSMYYSGNCGKYLVVTSPSGAILWVSPVFPGHISDRDLALYSFIYHGFERGWIQSGDDFMADRGFNIKDILFSIWCDLVIPPFKTRGSNQMSVEQSEISALVAHKRIHVERSIGVMKKKWGILKREISRVQWDIMTPIVRVCAWLTNEFTLPMVGEEDRIAMQTIIDARAPG